MLLAIDTATRMASLALYDEERGWILGEETWHSANNHTVELTPRLVRLLEQQGVAPVDLTGVVVSRGPGSFTGLRIGLSVAKGLALPGKLPIIGIPTLDVVAQPHKSQPLPICALIRAGRGRFGVGHYLRHRGRWRRRGPFRLATLAALCEEMKDPTLFCGELDASEVAQIRQQIGPGSEIATPAASLRRAAYLAEMGWARLSRGNFDDPAQLAPIYLRHPQIDA
jgi:tRNA threonylcarbamoyladenosine biosynthesis protein TsaB